jgi:hypothetical protein
MIKLILSALLLASCAPRTPQMLSLTGMITVDGPNIEFNKQLAKIPMYSPVSIYIDSPGGVVGLAEEISGNVVKLDASCYVRNAYSAALQIIMPTCRRIFAVENSSFGFHSAQFPLERLAISEIDSAIGLQVTHYVTTWMANIMNTMLRSDAKCPANAPDIVKKISETCTAQHMNMNTTLNPIDFNKLWKKSPVTIISQKEWDSLVGAGK